MAFRKNVCHNDTIMKKNDSLKFVFAGGGTGGHIYPGLAIADELRALTLEKGQKIEILWLGNSAGMDKKLVEESGSVDFFRGIPSGKLRRYFSLKNFLDIFKIGAGFFCSFFTLLRFRPVAVFSKGGFVSVPPCLAAHFLKIPVLTHECDFTPGLATRINSRFAKRILVSYEETKSFLSKNVREKAISTGNPVRPAFYSADFQKGKSFLFSNRNDYSPTKPILLVLGGSLGAHQINELVSNELDWLVERFNVVHQCGARDEAQMKRDVAGYFLHPFIYKEMPDVIASADVVLSRAGANSIWECAVLGKPLVLLPLTGSGTRGDQVDNARFFEKAGAAKILLGEDVNSQKLREVLLSLLDEKTRHEMAEKSLALANGAFTDGKRPAQKIAEIVLETALE